MIFKDEIISSILPEAVQDEYPTGFSVVGHVGKQTRFNVSEDLEP